MQNSWEGYHVVALQDVIAPAAVVGTHAASARLPEWMLEYEDSKVHASTNQHSRVV